MKVKYSIALTAFFALAGCMNPKAIQFDVSIPGIKNGVFIVYGNNSEKLVGENIIDGKCSVKTNLDETGFHQAVVVNGKGAKTGIELYLEPGTYTISYVKGGLKRHSYPTVQSTSKLQQELSNYNTMVDTTFRKKGSGDSAEYALLKQYIQKYPQSKLAAHFMMKQNLEKQPQNFMVLYEQMSADAQGSEDGMYIKQKLSSIIQTMPGAKAAAISGRVYDGRTFAQVTAGKKIFLIDFWRAANYISRNNHDIIRTVYDQYHSKGFDVISVSMDKRLLWWTTAVKDDKLPWPQMADLLGSDSPNAQNWNLTRVPTYYVVDGAWRILYGDIELKELELDVRQYLEKHP